MEVVREIAQAETYPDYRVALKDHPVDDIVMFKVYITEQENTTDENLTFEPDSEKVKESGLPGFEAPLVIIAIAVTMIYFNSRR